MAFYPAEVPPFLKPDPPHDPPSKSPGISKSIVGNPAMNTGLSESSREWQSEGTENRHYLFFILCIMIVIDSAAVVNDPFNCHLCIILLYVQMTQKCVNFNGEIRQKQRSRCENKEAEDSLHTREETKLKCSNSTGQESLWANPGPAFPRRIRKASQEEVLPAKPI